MLDLTTARSFNSSVKKAVTETTGQKVKIEIINSYNFSKGQNKKLGCWVRIYPEKGKTFSNEFRKSIFDISGFDEKSLINKDNISYGNIRSTGISVHVFSLCKLYGSTDTTIV